MKKTPSAKKACKKVATPLYKDPKQPVEARVKDLLRRMTLEEKIDQLTQMPIGGDINPNNPGEWRNFSPTYGSILSYCGGTKNRNEFQRLAVETTRLGIPIIWGFDVIHGWRTTFPVSLAQAGSFRPELTEKLSRISALEAWNDGGVNWTFSPMVEVAHDPRWGRVVEGYGEDPLTAQVFTKAAVYGYQGRKAEQLKKPGYIAACLKHFVGYSASEGGRDYAYTDISRRALWEWYLPPFEAGVAAGARTLMSSFNDITGTPAVANYYTQTEVLRNRWGFDGFIVSDWGSVSQLKAQRFSSDPAESAAASVVAGNDMCMSDGYYKNLKTLVEDGKLPVKVINKAVERVLRVKFQIGLFEHPYAPEKTKEEVCWLPEYLQAAVETARETIVLLKNEKNTLPLKSQKGKRIALIGPNGDKSLCHIGWWAALARDDEKHAPSLLTKAREFFPDSEIVFEPGCPEPFPASNAETIKKFDPKQLPAAVEAAKSADVILLAIGEHGHQSGEYHSRRDICLPPFQDELVDAIRKAAPDKPIIALVTAGRPLAFQETAKKVDAILYLWQSGYGASQATMEILTGKVNPSAKLAMTFPRTVGQIPVYVNAHHPARFDLHDYQDYPEEDGPWFPFGYGLSYTTFEYAEPVVKKGANGTFKVKVSVTNTGKKAGAETVIWYLHDLEAYYTQPVKRVVSFEKIDLEPGETKVVSLTLTPEMLSYVNEDGQRQLEEGTFEISASEKTSASFTVSL